ncbi:putative ribonuclease HII [Trypanosoma conorhini]|uniref:Ribonuclease n=1 Tax=Trypanosoma conorhini TaxID=83891 RepID=A0A422NU12_9TRYP|nr:putative ribonuclease HII [Trypanosoma conorhini]RNF08939.1 putative ribonuclease HII [Trypanosoma conorhini]
MACFRPSPLLLAGVLRRSATRWHRLNRVLHDRQPPWNPLQRLQLPMRKTVEGLSTLDGTLDIVGYQLFRDGLLLPPLSSFRTYQQQQQQKMITNALADTRKAPKERTQAESRMCKHGVVLRRSIKETYLTIGCDEAGRGPLAGPVVGAAVCRIPLSSFNNELSAVYDAREEFQIFDSKSLSEGQRNVVFQNITGYETLFDLVADKAFVVHHASGDAAPDNVLTKRFPSHIKLQKLPFKKLLSMQTPYLISYHGQNVCGNYLYLWAIGMANHAYIDMANIYVSSMRTMHRSCFAIWRMLNDTRFSLERAPRPKHCSIAQYLFSRYCVAAPHDYQKRYVVPSHVELVRGATDFFDMEPVQPPLVLVDGHAAPEETLNFFTDIQTGGCVQPIIEGDKRSLTIAAASCLAKVARDDVMNYVSTLYPRYQFAENKGYPVECHMRAVQRYGVSSIHRKSYKPCAAAITKQLKRKAKESQTCS